MSKCVHGVLLAAEGPRISRGDIRFTKLQVAPATGEPLTWEGFSMERSIADDLRIGVPTTFYVSSTWSTVYAARVEGRPGRFASFFANPLAMLMAIGMIFAGLATSMFLFPLLVALAGLAGVFMSADAMGARSRFKKDERALPPAPGPPAQIVS